MVNIKKTLKGQGLPLNTIVIAILVIIVLLVIIVFFTSKMGDSGQTFDANNPTSCSPTNPTFATLGYTYVGEVDEADDCDGEVVQFKTEEEGKVCCVTKE